MKFVIITLSLLFSVGCTPYLSADPILSQPVITNIAERPAGTFKQRNVKVISFEDTLSAYSNDEKQQSKVVLTLLSRSDDVCTEYINGIFLLKTGAPAAIAGVNSALTILPNIIQSTTDFVKAGTAVAGGASTFLNSAEFNSFLFSKQLDSITLARFRYRAAILVAWRTKSTGNSSRLGGYDFTSVLTDIATYHQLCSVVKAATIDLTRVHRRSLAYLLLDATQKKAIDDI